MGDPWRAVKDIYQSTCSDTLCASQNCRLDSPTIYLAVYRLFIWCYDNQSKISVCLLVQTLHVRVKTGRLDSLTVYLVVCRLSVWWSKIHIGQLAVKTICRSGLLAVKTIVSVSACLQCLCECLDSLSVCIDNLYQFDCLDSLSFYLPTMFMWIFRQFVCLSRHSHWVSRLSIW